jgi:hypothetical protein
LHDLAERISGGAIVPPPAIDPRTLKAAFEKFRLDQREQFVAPAFPATPKLLQIRLSRRTPVVIHPLISKTPNFHCQPCPAPPGGCGMLLLLVCPLSTNMSGVKVTSF